MLSRFFKITRTFKLLGLCATFIGCMASAHANLPETVSKELKAAGISEKDISIVVMDAQPGGKTWLAHNEAPMMSPASVIKLVTTYAALDLLGPNYTWKTAVFTDGTVSNGNLYGSLYIRGSGDPSMTADRMRELLVQIKAAGIETIHGSLLIDRSAYALADVDPAAFDGEPLRPYNVRPETLLINFKTVAFIFNPSVTKAGDHMPVIMTPPLTGVKFSTDVSTNNQRSCGDWQQALQADFSDPLNIKFNGSFPTSCGAKQWYIAYPDPQSHTLRTVGALWQELGGSVKGLVSFGKVPVDAKLVAVGESKTLAEVVRDVNKYSNNVMAQSVFLALSLPDQKLFMTPDPITSPATLESSRQIIAQWWLQKLPGITAPVMDNGSGLSRSESISVLALSSMLRQAWISSVMPEFVSSLPIASVDGTMRRSRATASAHIKTGSMRDVTTRAGYVLALNGQRRILVFFVNSPKAYDAKGALDALIDWTAEQK